MTWLRRQFWKARDLADDQRTVALLHSRNFMPDAVLIQISRGCNLRCVMCGWTAWKRNKGFMSRQLYEHILFELQQNGIKNVNITNPQGEPLLSPFAIDFLRRAVNLGFTVQLNTNCTPLGDRLIHDLVEITHSGKLAITASFSGYDKPSYEKVYAGANFDMTWPKLCALNDALVACGLEDHLTINGIVMDAGDVEKTLKFLSAMGISRKRCVMGLPDNFAGIVQVGTEQHGLYTHKKDLDWRGLRLCNLLAHYLLIYDDGKVSACACRDSEGVMEIGDITKETLAEIRNGERYQKMVDAFMRRDLSEMSLCQKCDIPYGDHENEKLFVGVS